MKNEAIAQIVENGNGRFVINTPNGSLGSYSRRRDAVRAAGRKGLTVEN